jgi:hypothetical protein
MTSMSHGWSEFHSARTAHEYTFSQWDTLIVLQGRTLFVVTNVVLTLLLVSIAVFIMLSVRKAFKTKVQ